MATNIDTFANVWQTITTDEYRSNGFYTFVSVRTPNEERYKNTLEAIGYEGEVGSTPDRNGNVNTLFTLDDNSLSVNVYYQGPKPEKPEKDDSSSDTEPSEAESDLVEA